MRKLLLATSIAALLMPVVAAAQSAFNGTWKTDLNQVNFSKKPDVYVLKDGMYSCKTCIPPYTVKADGTDQPIPGNPYIDSVAIEVVNDHEVKETDKKNGKVVSKSTVNISPDGKTATFEFSNWNDATGGPPVTGKGEQILVAKGPAGSHAISGSWRMSKLENVSNNAATTTYKVEGDTITDTSPTGQGYTAKLNGPEAPVKGDPGATSVRVKMIGKNTLEETYLRKGKVIGVFKMTVSEDGSVAHASYTNTRANKTDSWVMMKQ